MLWQKLTAVLGLQLMTEAEPTSARHGVPPLQGPSGLGQTFLTSGGSHRSSRCLTSGPLLPSPHGILVFVQACPVWGLGKCHTMRMSRRPPAILRVTSALILPTCLTPAFLHHPSSRKPSWTDVATVSTGSFTSILLSSDAQDHTESPRDRLVLVVGNSF